MRAGEPDLPLLLMDGYDGLIQRVRALAEHPDLSQPARDVLDGLLDYHQDETVARDTAEGYLEAAERLVEVYKALERQAKEQGVPVARLDAWPTWHEAAEMLATTGEAILADEDRYGAYLDALTLGRSRARLTVKQLRNRIGENRAYAAKPEARKPRREPPPRQEQGFAHTLDEPRKPRTRREPTDEGQQQGFAHTLFESDKPRQRTGQSDEGQQEGFAHLLDRPPAKPMSKSGHDEGFAHILDDPERLRELLEKVEKQDRKHGRHLRRSRGLSM